MNHYSFPNVLRLLLLLALALALGTAISTHTPAQADALWQTSPLAVPQDQVSPLPAGTNPAPTTLPRTADATDTSSVAGRAPIPVAALVGLMAVIALAAVVISLRKRNP